MGSDQAPWQEEGGQTYFNPRPPHGERPRDLLSKQCEAKISIHAPRMGSDDGRIYDMSEWYYFNPRPPHGERRMNKENMKWLIHFNPRPPHGERLAVPILVEYIKQISIHAPRMGSDIPASSKFSMILRFQSTPPAWGATIALNGQFAFQKHFNPRPPHGERRRAPPIAIRNLPFQSTPPHGERQQKHEISSLFL